MHEANVLVHVQERTKENQCRRKVQKQCLKKGKYFSKVPVGDGGPGGSTFATKVYESIRLKLHRNAKAGYSVLV